MTSPLKPWEQANLNSSPSLEYSLAPSGGRPTVPPRPTGISKLPGLQKSLRPNHGLGYSYGGMGAYGGLGSYGGMGSYGGYGSYGGHGGVGAYGSYGGMYGDSNNIESRWIQRAEEGARPTFESIESVVRVFGSMASMLDSTFFAITSTFRAVLAVTENFGQLRTMFGRIWRSVALFRNISLLYRKLLQKLGFVGKRDNPKDAWKEAMNASISELGPNSSGWPVLFFLGAIVAAPYIFSKLFPEPIEKKDSAEMIKGAVEAVVLHDFKGASPAELSVRQGDTVLIASQATQGNLGLAGSGWLQGTFNGVSGIIPASYVKPKNLVAKKKAIPRATPKPPGISSGPAQLASIFDMLPSVPAKTAESIEENSVILTDKPKKNKSALEINIHPVIPHKDNESK